jgi:mercuric reductase
MTIRMRMAVAGMSCDSCNVHVAGALRAADAADVEADWRRGEATLTVDDGADLDRMAAAVRDAGYHPGEVTLLEPAVPDREGGGSDVDYDLLVLGGGSAAFAAAITARDAGRAVALVESGVLGGTCVNVGCVPSKALLAAGEAAWQAARHRFDGVPHATGRVDVADLVAAKDELVAQLRQAKYVDLVNTYGFDVIPGRGRFVDPATVEVAGRRVRAGAFLIATGASPAAPPVPGLAEAGCLTSTTAVELKDTPRRLAVLGANAVGLELGQYFLHLGAEVSFVEVADRIAPFEEPEVSAALAEVLVEQGARVLTGARVRTVARRGEVRVLDVEVDGETVEVAAEELLVATGRSPNTTGLGLDAAGVAVDERGAVAVDAGLRTSNPRVWAAGDVTGAAQLVYVSAYHGALAAGNALLGADRRVDYTGLPRVIFTAPQLAAAGLTEAQARAAGHQVKVAVLPLSAVPRALVARETHGLVKLVADAATDRLLGASVLGAGAGDVIQSAVLAIRHGITAAELAATFHPYLTMAEGLKLAALSFTRDVAALSCCAA